VRHYIAQRAEWNRAVNQFMANGQVIPGYLYNGKWKVTVFSMQLQKLGLLSYDDLLLNFIKFHV
jgi:hypothetical protein